jgi:glycosyltransferase involved in cell wall biosynthesis
MRACLLQNSVGIGGRSKVLSEAVSVLESQAYGIDIITLSGDKKQQKFIEHYGIDEHTINFISYPGSTIPGTIYQQPLLNFLSRDKLSQYDLVFNSNNCIRFLPETTNYVHYIHFPGPAIPKIDPKYERTSYELMSYPYRLICRLTENSVPGKVFSNSKFTKEYIELVHDFSHVDVLYPPSLGSVDFTGFSGSGVVSLGSFHPNKRQLFQLRVAEHFPNIQFKILGSIASEKYFNRCKDYIRKNNIENVVLIPDATEGTVKQSLEDSRIFLHSMENEHFGIAIVESLNAGCIPVVPDSGGQKEIIPDRNFRYNSFDGCLSAINRALEHKFPDIVNVREHLSQFSNTNFREELLDQI